MNEKLEIALDYLKIFLAWCKLHPKFLSTLFLLFLTFITLTIALSTDIPENIFNADSGKNNGGNEIFNDFQFSASQMEWVLNNCGFYSCIDGLCYCYVSSEKTWTDANTNCQSSGLPNAQMMKPLKVEKEGVFATYRGLVAFMRSMNMYLRPMWTGLWREHENEDFMSEKGVPYKWFHTYKRGDGNSYGSQESCVFKINSKGWARLPCADHSSTVNLPPEFADIILAEEDNQKYLRWATPQAEIYVNVAILCELDTTSMDNNSMALVNDNLGSTFIETDDELKYYFFKEDFKFWRQNRKNGCSTGFNLNNAITSRAVIKTKEEEQFVLDGTDKMDRIFLEIGLGNMEDSYGQLKWDNNGNGMAPEDMRWFYNESMRSAFNCLATQSFSHSDLQIDWAAVSCREASPSICTFTPPKLKKQEVAASFEGTYGTYLNHYRSFFCIGDNGKERCFAALSPNFETSIDFLRGNDLKVAVLNEKEKDIVKNKIKPRAGVFVGASAMRLGNTFEWLYGGGLVKLNPSEKEAIHAHMADETVDRKMCLVLLSDGTYSSTSCGARFETLIELDKNSFDFLKLSFW